MKTLTPAALKWVKNLSEGRLTASHPSQRDAALENGYVIRVDREVNYTGYVVTEKGLAALAAGVKP